MKEAIDPAVGDILTVVARLKRERNVDVKDILNGDPIHDRSVIAGAALEAELTSATDWGDVASKAFTVAWSILKVAAGVAAILA